MATLRESLRGAGRALGEAWRKAGAALANTRRRLLRAHLPEFVVFTLDGALADLAPRSAWWERFVPGMQPPQSIQSIQAALRRVAADPDVRGVLFLIKGATLPRTRAQNLAALFDRFRAWDRAFHGAAQPKSITLFLEQVTPAAYTVACAADRICVTPLTVWEVLGVHIEQEYYRDALARLGVRAEVVRVAPWKTAADMLSEAEMSPAAREQYEWLLDSLYTELVRAIAQGRGLGEAAVRALIDRAPLSAAEAHAAGLVDAVCYEDELPALLETKPTRLKRYGAVRRLLYRRVLPRTEKPIGLIDLSGSIMTGPSRRSPIPLPLLGSVMLGSSSVQQMVRAARRRDDLAAVVAYVDSPGGSALASDLMWRELLLLAQEKPLVVYMGPVAASGGYYVATPAHAVVAQQATLTGSIGVITAKLITEEAYAKLGVGRGVVQRGANADLYTSSEPWDARQRERVEANVRTVYAEFQQRVADGRSLTPEQVEAVAGGRVWTGAQGVAHGLVDALGDLTLAFETAARLAQMEVAPTTEIRAARIDAGRGRLLAQPAQAGQAAWAVWAAWAARTLARLIGPAAQPDAAVALLRHTWEDALRADRCWLLADRLPRVE